MAGNYTRVAWLCSQAMTKFIVLSSEVVSDWHWSKSKQDEISLNCAVCSSVVFLLSGWTWSTTDGTAYVLLVGDLSKES